MKIGSILFLALLLVGCRTYGPKFDAYQADGSAAGQEFAPVELTNRIDSALLKAPIEPYRLGPGDVIQIEPVGEAMNSATVRLGPDGKIYYSLLPGISLWGFSLAESRTLLQQEMAKYTRMVPEFVVHLRGVGSQRIWMLGAVRSPGVYGLATPTTLLDALAIAGGVAAGGTDDEGSADSETGQTRQPSKKEALREILTGRSSSGQAQTRGGPSVSGVDDGVDWARSFVMRKGKFLPVDFERLIKQGDLSQNIYLAPDDFVFFRPVELPSVYVLGAVAGPTILPYSGDLSVATAILNVGGTIQYAQQNKVVIIRGALTQPKIAEVNYHAIVTGKARDLLLQPGDIVFVPFTPFRRVAQLAEEVLNQFVRTIAVNEGSYIGSGREQPVGVTAPGFGINVPQ